jgi:hypothetical protein
MYIYKILLGSTVALNVNVECESEKVERERERERESESERRIEQVFIFLSHKPSVLVPDCTYQTVPTQLVPLPYGSSLFR